MDITGTEPAQPAEQDGEPPTRFRYVLWSHASHDIPPGPRGRPRAAARAGGAADSDGAASADAVADTHEQR
jgi:hypothetical protein